MDAFACTPPPKPRPRAREYGVVIGRLDPGPHNAITDVAGVRVGHCTVIAGAGSPAGADAAGERAPGGGGAARTGVTAILPHEGNLFRDKVEAAIHQVNGFGKPTGLAQVAELGQIETPIVLTNTLSVGVTYDAVVRYMLRDNPEIGVTTGTVNPVVLECNDGHLNDIRGGHVHHEHVWRAIAAAAGGPVQEGTVGAGTGMTAFGFKGGIGTSSRQVSTRAGLLTVGTLVLANFGRRADLRIDGVPVGLELRDWHDSPAAPPGSVVVVVATDAPLDARQLGRLARRAAIGLARTGSTAANGSGDFVVAFSTTRRTPHFFDTPLRTVPSLIDDGETAGLLFAAAIESTEEAVIDALFCATSMKGRDDHYVPALPVPEVLEIMRRYGRLPRT